MVEKSPEPSNPGSSEPKHISESLANLDDVLAADAGPKTPEQLEARDLNEVRKEAEAHKEDILKRRLTGEEEPEDGRLEDELAIEIRATQNQQKGLQNDLPKEE